MELDGLPVPAARKCLGILICVSTMWATEAVPHYVTSLLIPMLVVSTGTLLPPKGKDCSLRDKACLAERYKPYPPHEAAKEITGQFFDPTVLLFMAGFR
jgi:phosphate transporter